MAELLKYISPQIRESIFPELKHAREFPQLEPAMEKRVLVELSRDKDRFKLVFRNMISNGLSTNTLKQCSRQKVKEWDVNVALYFEQMSFDSVWNREDKFPLAQYEHSFIISIPLKQEEVDRLLFIKQICEESEEDPCITRSMLLVVEKQYQTIDQEPEQCLQVSAKTVFEDCHQVLLRVNRLEVRHFFNLDKFCKKKEEQSLKQQQEQGKSADVDLLLLDPIFVTKFEEKNCVELYVSLLEKLKNVTCLEVDMLTQAFVDALIVTGRSEFLQHALINREDPRNHEDYLAVERLMLSSKESLKLLRSGNCFQAVIGALKKGESFPKLEELVTKQKDKVECFQLMDCVVGIPDCVPRLSSIVLQNGGMLLAPLSEFLPRVLNLIRRKETVVSVSLDLRRTDLPAATQANELLKVSGVGIGRLETLGLIIDPSQAAKIGFFLKAFAGIKNLWVFVMTGYVACAKQTVEQALLDPTRPRKFIWNILPSLKCIKVFNSSLKQEAVWNR